MGQVSCYAKGKCNLNLWLAQNERCSGELLKKTQPFKTVQFQAWKSHLEFYKSQKNRNCFEPPWKAHIKWPKQTKKNLRH